MSIFILEVFERVNRDRLDEYLRRSRETDEKVFSNEPGMMVHVQTKVNEDDSTITYRWQETFQSFEDYKVHVQHPDVAAHMEKLNDGVLAGPIEVVVYCDWPEERKQKWRERTTNLEFADIVCGYLR